MPLPRGGWLIILRKLNGGLSMKQLSQIEMNCLIGGECPVGTISHIAGAIACGATGAILGTITGGVAAFVIGATCSVAWSFFEDALTDACNQR